MIYYKILSLSFGIFISVFSRKCKYLHDNQLLMSEKKRY